MGMVESLLQALWQPLALRGILNSMLQLSGALLNRPILSLRTGTPVAFISRALINPNNLKVEGFYCQPNDDRRKTLILLCQDIRDTIPQGFVINDLDVLAEPAELVRLQEVIKIDFELIGKQVVTDSKEKIGKVSDYAVETSSMFVQKLYVSRSVFKSFASGNLGIDRTQIIEVTDRRVVVSDLHEHVPAHASAIA
jgi:sporulation protein YlmC with PRC-barrel domain